MKLLTITNHKTTKGESKGYLTGILYLAPHKLSGVNLCPFASKGCIAACLNTAGRGAFSNVQLARLKKTQWLIKDRTTFKLQLAKDIQSLEYKAKRLGLTPVVRLNGTSDIRWENIAPELFVMFSDIQFYDYTKWPIDKRKNLPANYHLTYSATELLTPKELSDNLLARNVAVVVADDSMKQSMLRDSKLLAVDGDKDDLRFLDPSHNHLILLTAKGKARKDSTGFVFRS